MSTLNKRIERIEQRASVSNDQARQVLDRFKQRRVTREDVERIARGDWASVSDLDLKEAKHRERWELAAPVVLQAIFDERDAENAAQVE